MSRGYIAPAAHLTATLLRADQIATNSSGLGEPANQAHGARVLRVSAEALECILICEIDYDQRMTIGWSVVNTIAYALHTWDTYQEMVSLAQCLVNNFAAHSQFDPQDYFMPNHSVIQHLLFHAHLQHPVYTSIQ